MELGRRRWRKQGLIALTVLTLAACGTSGSDSPDPSNSSETTSRVSPAGAEAGCAEAPVVPSAGQTPAPLEAPQGKVSGTLSGVIETNCGPIEVELYADLAPETVRSFQHLAEAAYWENSPCHRLTTEGIFVLQCGDPTGTGRGAPGYTFGIENAPEDGKYPPGTLAMARAQDPNSNGGQFFIVYQDTELPVSGGGYSIFGKVTDGMDIVDRVAEQGVDGGGADGPPAAPISILSVEVTQEKASE